MNDKNLVVISTWIGAIILLVIGTVFQLDFIGMIIFIAIIFALSAFVFMGFGVNDTQDMAEVEHDVSQLKYEVKTLHAKIDDIKKLVDY